MLQSSRRPCPLALVLAGFLVTLPALAQEGWITRIDGPREDGWAQPVCSSLTRGDAIVPDGTGGAFVFGVADTPARRNLLMKASSGATTELVDLLPEGFGTVVGTELVRNDSGLLGAIGTLEEWDGTTNRKQTWVAAWEPDGKRRHLRVLEFATTATQVVSGHLAAGPGDDFFGVSGYFQGGTSVAIVFRVNGAGEIVWQREVQVPVVAELVALSDGRVALVEETGPAPRAHFFGADGQPLGAVVVGNDPTRSETVRSAFAAAQGRLVIAGASCDENGDCDALTTLVAADGSVTWSRRVRPVGIGDWDADLVVEDDAGRIVLAGVHVPAGGSPRVVVAALDPEGGDLWVDDSIGGTGNSNAPFALIPIPPGSVAVAGEFDDIGHGSDAFVARFDSAEGSLIWSEVVDSGVEGSDAPCDLVVDPGSGRLLIAARAARRTQDVWVLALSPAGTTEWSAAEPAVAESAQRLGAGTSNRDLGRLALTATADGAVVVAGRTSSSKGLQGFVGQVDAAGGVDWTALLGSPGARFPELRAVASAADGSLFVAGVGGDRYGGFMTAAYGPDGQLRWRHVATPLDFADVANAVAALPDGGAVVTGEAYRSGTYDAFTARYDALGNLLWTAAFHEYVERGIDVVALPDQSTVVLVDTSLNDFPSSVCNLVSYDAIGGPSGWTRIVSPAGGAARCTDLAVAGDSELIVVGRADGRALVARVAADGSILWRTLAGTEGTRTLARAVEVLPSGEILAAGEVDLAGRSAAWLAKFSSDGELAWERIRALPAPGHSGYRDLAMGPDGRIHGAALSSPGAAVTWLDLVTHSPDGELMEVVSSEVLPGARASDSVAVTATGAGSIVAAASASFEGASSDILLISIPANRLFADGFETGDGSRWSSSAF